MEEENPKRDQFTMSNLLIFLLFRLSVVCHISHFPSSILFFFSFYTSLISTCLSGLWSFNCGYKNDD